MARSFAGYPFERLKNNSDEKNCNVFISFQHCPGTTDQQVQPWFFPRQPKLPFLTPGGTFSRR